MRVLHVYSGNLYGGIERMLATLAGERHLAPDMEPHFALCFEGRLSTELGAAGAPLHHIGPARASRPLTVLRARARLRQVLASSAFDVAICHAPWSHALFSDVIRRARVPLVFFQHDQATGRHWTERVARRHRPVRAICNSRFTARSLHRLFPETPWDVLHCPVHPPAPSSRVTTRRSLQVEPDTIVIVQVARMEPWKGQRELVRALARLRTERPWTCWLIGGAQRRHEDRFRAQLGDEVTALGLADRVRFLGERTDVSALLHAADVCCHPTRSPEPFGIAVVEALWAGLPVIAFDAGGPAELLDSTCGVLVPPHKEGALTRVLTRLVEDDALRERLSARGPARARTLADPALQLPRLYAILERATGRSA